MKNQIVGSNWENLYKIVIKTFCGHARIGNKLDRSLHILKEKPESFPKSDIVKGLYKCVVTKQTTVYYKFDSKKLYVVTIFDTRQDPNKLNKETQ